MTVDGFGFGTLTGESCLKNVHCHTDRASWDAILVTVIAFGALMWKKCAQSHRFGLGRGRGDTIGGGSANREPGSYIHIHIYIYIYRHLLRVCIFSICINMYVCAHKHTQVSACMLTPTIAKESKSRAKNQLLRGKGGLQEPKNLPLPPANGSFRKFRVPYFGVLIIMRILLFRALY